MANDSLENYTEAQREQLARTALSLLNHPDVSKDAKRLIKKIDPKVNFPDVEVEDRFETFRTEQAEREKKRDEEERVRRANEQYQETCAKIAARGFKVEDVEKLMKEKGIANYETAMDFIDQERRLAPATPDSLYTMKMPDTMSTIMKEGKNFARNRAHAAIDELGRMRRQA